MLQSVPIILFLALLEGILSIDNAVVLAMLAKKLPPPEQKKALTYGLVGAMASRLILLVLIVQIVRWPWVKFLGGGYLLFLACKQLLKSKAKSKRRAKNVPSSFWRTVLVIELTDIIFALDSVLAAVAVSDNYWIVFLGGVIGIIIVRFSAAGMISLLEKYPHLERTGYYLVFFIGAKLIVDGFGSAAIDFQSPENAAFWIFWSLMLATVLLAVGMTVHKKNHAGRF